MFFRKTKRDVLQKATELQESFDHAVDEMTLAKAQLLVTSQSYMLRLEEQLDSFRKAAIIAGACYSAVLFGMLFAILFFVIF